MEIHMYDVGVKFEVTVLDSDGNPYSFEDNPVLSFLFQKPSGALLTKNGFRNGDGTDGKVTYTTTTNDLDEQGIWKYQIQIYANNFKLHSNISNFRVYPNLPLE